MVNVIINIIDSDIHINMELKNLFGSSQNTIYSQNIELLDYYDLINSAGSPDRMFLKYIKSKNINIRCDEITEDIINDFERSIDSINLKSAKIQRIKDTIFKQRKVWINILEDGELIGTDMHLNHEGICIRKTAEKILYSEMHDIEITDGGWSKKRFTIITKDSDIVFEINEEWAIPLMEILEANIHHKNYNELDELMELYGLYENGEITLEELERRKDAIYNDNLYCTNCGHKLDSGSEYCSECGHKI